jgi:hypothetical protein
MHGQISSLYEGEFRMWTVLTTTGGLDALVNLAQATDIQTVKSGTKISFGNVSPDKEGRLTARSIVVKESVSSLLQALKATKP